MTRALSLLAAVALLGLSAAAVAVAAKPRTGTFTAPKGKIQYGYDFKFEVDKGGKRIRDLVANVLENCDGSSMSTVTTMAPDSTWRVKGGKFKGRKKEKISGVTVYTTLRGKFTSPNTAKGIVRQESLVMGHTCDTYELKFTAKR